MKPPLGRDSPVEVRVETNLATHDLLLQVRLDRVAAVRQGAHAAEPLRAVAALERA